MEAISQGSAYFPFSRVFQGKHLLHSTEQRFFNLELGGPIPFLDPGPPLPALVMDVARIKIITSPAK
jgi:hypothetical protein